MDDELSPENKDFVECELATGGFDSRGELFNEALRVLRKRRQLRTEILDGVNSGESIPASKVFETLPSTIASDTDQEAA